jgi:hypothetical protein
MENYFGIVIIILVVAMFATILFSGRKLKEYAVYGVDGDILHLWRRQQNTWFEWGGNMVFYEDANGEIRTVIQSHWVKRYSELKDGEWEKLAKEISEK